MARRLRLKVANGELKDRIYEVKPGGLRLGRSSSNDIHLPDEELSRNHCYFDTVGEYGVRVTDLASANGTFLNGKVLSNDPVELHEGDLISVGSTTLMVIDEDRPVTPLSATSTASTAATSVDLGLDAKPQTGTNSSRRSPFMRILWLLALAIAGVAIYLTITAPRTVENVPQPVKEEEPILNEVAYEHVSANCEGIFRYEMKLAEDGTLSVRIDDVPAQNRHHAKSKVLSEAERKELSQILAFRVVRDIDREYAGVEPDPPALESWKLKLVYSTRARSINIVNTQEPDAFRQLREKLEAFCKSSLGIWAIQYPKEKLIALAEESVQLGQTKWEDRDVNFGNLAASIAAYREAMFYLETVDPRPPTYVTARDGMERSTEELNRRYADQRFLADRALNLGQFDIAKRELLVLLEMVPDRSDDRYRETNEKLLSVERQLQMKKGGK